MPSTLVAGEEVREFVSKGITTSQKKQFSEQPLQRLNQRQNQPMM